ncbi:heme-binding domain-containing protein [Arcobacter sp. FWKO B]|uniref:heme-binding domain-containing protein n=1 Tax=Arcobacter sp. FWKO B TaxID=2593672 RepID=UPI0018A55254|nr:heme-binding domain-containing protein [Arcobacter sp. FWKO B]QOG13009.1 cytochrome C [Arcobacter sp. FWKO B]
MKITLITLILIFIGMQFIPVDRTNPEFDKSKEIFLPEHIKPLIKDACYDCHSYETKWPWYSSIAPMSYSVSKNVAHARQGLNFSIWEDYDDETKHKKMRELFRAVYAAMPLGDYIRFHAEADLTKEQRTLIRDWAKEIIDAKEMSASK